MSKIIINLNEANRTQEYKNGVDNNELFQIEAFKNISKILANHTSEGSDDISMCRFHSTIFIDGNRGVGKTAFMLNVDNFYKTFKLKDENDNKIKVNKPNYKFLKPVDPTLLEHTEKFLSVVLARVVQSVNEQKNIDDEKLENYFRTLEKLSKSLSAIKTLPEDTGLDEIASNKSSIMLEQHAHEFFKEVSCLFNVNALVILIDDVDMAFDKGYEVLEVVRKYMASPYLIPIVAGDMNLYKEIVETNFIKKNNFHEDIKYLKSIYEDIKELKKSIEYKNKKKLIDNLVEQYFKKVFPIEFRIKLDNIFKIINENSVEVKLSDKNIDFKYIYNFELRQTNVGVNRLKFMEDVFRNNTRDLMQHLFAKQDIYELAFQNGNKIVDKEVLQNIIINKTSLYQNSLKFTAKTYENSSDKVDMYKLLENDLNSYKNNKYNIYQAFLGNVFKNNQINKEEKNKNLVIEYRNLQKYSNYENIEKFIIDLFVFKDSISEHQTKNYLYSGKFIEMLIYSFSISQSIDIKYEAEQKIKDLLENINLDYIIKKKDFLLYSILYDSHSNHVDIGNKKLSEYFSNLEINIPENHKLDDILNKTPFNFNDNELFNDESESEDEELLINNKDKELLKNEMYDEIFRKMIIWKNIYCKNIMLNSLSLMKIIEKFFNNYNQMKLESNNDKPLIYMQRTVLIFINAIAYYEKENGKIADTNIATSKEFNLENILRKTNASTLNIKPMLEVEGSLTRALFFHPLISHILFPEFDKTILNELRFVNQVKIEIISKEAREIFDYIKKVVNPKVYSQSQRVRIINYIIRKTKTKKMLNEIYNIKEFKEKVIEKDINKKIKISTRLIELINKFYELIK